MASKVKLEHYVPQFYLRNFSMKNDRRRVYCFDKPTAKTFVSNIKNIACERYFYDFPTKDDKSVEKNLSKIEPALAAAYDKLITGADLNKLNWEERVSMAVFIAIQEIRTKEMRESLSDMIKQFEERLRRDKLSPSLEKQLQRVAKEEYPKELQIAMLKKVRDFSDIILGMKWILIENNTKTPNWTSDHPISRWNPIDLSPYGNLGYLCRGIQIFFPLTSSLSLSVCDLGEYSHYPDKMRAFSDNVVFQNSQQVMWATRHILSENNDFSLAEKILEEHPELKNPDRKRMTVQ